MELVKIALSLLSILFAAVGSLSLVMDPGVAVVAWYAGGIWALAAFIALEIKGMNRESVRAEN